MARLLPAVVLLQILLGWFELCALQTTLTHLRSVQLGGNVTLACDITADYEIYWILHVSEEMQLLVSFSRAKLNKELSLSYTLNDSHYDVTENKTSSKFSLTIVNVSKTDLGMYYCAGRNKTTFTQFSKVVRLISADEGSTDTDSQSELLETEDCPGTKRLGIIILSLTFVSSVSFLINIINMCCYYRRQLDVKSVLLSTCCSKTSINASLTKEEGLHYPCSEQHTGPGEREEKDTECVLVHVTYTRVESLPRKA